MSKKTWTSGELITKTSLDTLLISSKDEPLYGKLVTKTAAFDMVADTDTAIVVCNGTSAIVPVKLPAATGSGRVIIVTTIEKTNACTITVQSGDALNAGTIATLDPVYEAAICIDIAATKWLMIVSMAAITT